MVYQAGSVGQIIQRTTDLGLASWLQPVYLDVGRAGSRHLAGDSLMIRYPDHLHALLEPTSVTSSCDNSHSQGMGLGIIVVAGTRLNLSGCRQRNRFPRRFTIHWEGRSIPRRGTIKNFLRSSYNDKKHRYGSDTILHRLYPALARRDSRRLLVLCTCLDCSPALSPES